MERLTFFHSSVNKQLLYVIGNLIIFYTFHTLNSHTLFGFKISGKNVFFFLGQYSICLLCLSHVLMYTKWIYAALIFYYPIWCRNITRIHTFVHWICSPRSYRFNGITNNSSACEKRARHVENTSNQPHTDENHIRFHPYVYGVLNEPKRYSTSSTHPYILH